MSKAPYPYKDFTRVQDTVLSAIDDPDETYILVTGDTGTGKTALLKEVKSELERTHVRICYFSHAKKLGPTGLIKVIGETLRIRSSMCHAVSFDRLLRALNDEAHHILLWFDEAHELPHDTLGEARALAESDLDGEPRIQILLAGLPRLRQTLQMQPHLWRRVLVREEIDGLQRDEMAGFVEHHFGAVAAGRLCDRGRHAIFEHGKGAPGLLLPPLKKVFKAVSGKARIDPVVIEELLARYDLA